MKITVTFLSEKAIQFKQKSVEIITAQLNQLPLIQLEAVVEVGHGIGKQSFPN